MMDRLRSRSSIPGERPLNPAARGALVVGTAATILLFYATSVAAMAGLGLLALVLLSAAMLAARFGMAAYLTRLLAVPVRLIGILARNLWLPSGPAYHLALQPSDAPGLFKISHELARRLSVQPPQSISVEMNAGAWVQLKGFRRASGRTTLGIGFDLLAGLTIAEAEAVVAHEMAHARLVQRGFSRWLKKGLARLSRVTGNLSDCAAGYRAANAQSDLADDTLRLFDALTRRAARLVATYSRQDEFAADRGAAELCGTAAIRSALVRLHELEELVGQLPWSERLARLQPGERFSEWLVNELVWSESADDSALIVHAVDAYSTHPSLADRLAALPADDRPLGDTRPGLTLLAEPDRIAERLATEIQRTIAAQERQDTRRLARETRKLCRRGEWGLDVLGWIAVALAAYLLMSGLAEGLSFDLAGIAIPLGFGVWLIRRGRHRDRRDLPVPAYGTLNHPRPPETHEQLAAAEQAVVAELQAAISGQPRKRARVAALVEGSYAALRESDYLRAHVAARLALGIDPRSVEARLGYAIAAAGLGSAKQATGALGEVKRRVGLKTLNTKWGAAWAMTLLGDWKCEGLLQQLHDRQPAVATFASLLAFVQLNRNKLHSAIQSAEAGVALDPANRACALLLAHLLLLAGRADDAAARLVPLREFLRTDTNGALMMVRVGLMRRDVVAAGEWAEVVRSLDKEGASLITLGHAFGFARQVEPAATFFRAALDARYIPEAHIGLATLARLRGDRPTARRHLLAALNFDGAKLSTSQAGAVFHEIVGRLNALDEQRLACQAWIAAIPAGTLPLSGRSVLVYAQGEPAARRHLETIATAMQGNGPVWDLSGVSWRLAPGEQQPVRPVWPGVQSVVA